LAAVSPPEKPEKLRPVLAPLPLPPLLAASRLLLPLLAPSLRLMQPLLAPPALITHLFYELQDVIY
jgi:hypothetical protein